MNVALPPPLPHSVPPFVYLIIRDRSGEKKPKRSHKLIRRKPQKERKNRGRKGGKRGRSATEQKRKGEKTVLTEIWVNFHSPS